MPASASMRCDFSAAGVGIRSEASDHGPPGSPPCLHHKLARPPSEKGTAATSPVLKSEAHSPIDRHSDLSTSYACTLLLPPHPRRKPPATSSCLSCWPGTHIAWWPATPMTSWAPVEKRSLRGSQRSVLRVGTSCHVCFGVQPPATSTLPSGSKVAVAFVRDSTILGPVRHVFASGSRI